MNNICEFTGLLALVESSVHADFDSLLMVWPLQESAQE